MCGPWVLAVMVLVCCVAQPLMENEDFLISVLEWSDTDGVSGKWQLPMVMASAKSSGAGFAEKSMFLIEILKGNGNEKNPRFFGGFSRCYDGVGQLLMGQRKGTISICVWSATDGAKKRHHQCVVLGFSL